jgi:hypothetical protein
MGAQVQERDIIERPIVDPWRRRPTREQIRFAMDLCKTELPFAERVATIRTFAVMDCREMSGLIDQLKDIREKRLARLRGKRRPRR